MTLTIKMISDDNKLSNGAKFLGKITKYLQTLLYLSRLKLLLGLHIKIIITLCTFIITTSLADVRSSKKAK